MDVIRVVYRWDVPEVFCCRLTISIRATCDTFGHARKRKTEIFLARVSPAISAFVCQAQNVDGESARATRWVTLTRTDSLIDTEPGWSLSIQGC